MKKKIIILLAFTLLVSACGEVPKLKSGEDAILTFKDEEKVSIDTLYEEMKDTYALATVIDLMDKTILEKEYHKKLDEVKEEAKKETERVKKMFGYDQSNFNEDFFMQYLRQAYGVNTVEALENSIYLGLLREEATNSYVASTLTDKEMKAYYDKEIYGDIQASHILIKVPNDENMSGAEKKDAEKKAKETAEQIINDLKKAKNLKEEFAKVAKEKSEDLGSKDLGGDLGFFDTDTMVAEFTEAAFALKKGEMTDTPVKSEHGFHIILKVDEKEKPSLEASKDKITEALVNKKLEGDKVLPIKAIIDIRKKYDMKITDSKLAEQYAQYMNYQLNTANK